MEQSLSHKPYHVIFNVETKAVCNIYNSLENAQRDLAKVSAKFPDKKFELYSKDGSE